MEGMFLSSLSLFFKQGPCETTAFVESSKKVKLSKLALDLSSEDSMVLRIWLVFWCFIG